MLPYIHIHIYIYIHIYINIHLRHEEPPIRHAGHCQLAAIETYVTVETYEEPVITIQPLPRMACQMEISLNAEIRRRLYESATLLQLKRHYTP